MDLITILIVAVAIAGALLLFLIEDAFDKLTDWFFSLIGLQSGKGPLTAEAVVHGERTVLHLVNQGNHRLRLIAVEGRDRRDSKHYPVPYLSEQDFHAPSFEESARKQFSKVALGPGASQSVFLKTSDLAALDCQVIAILDSNGRAWPVDGYNPGDTRASSQQTGGA